eukprot:12126609-Alexandrium_andersonii.AAC.1
MHARTPHAHTHARTLSSRLGPILVDRQACAEDANGQGCTMGRAAPCAEHSTRTRKGSTDWQVRRALRRTLNGDR